MHLSETAVAATNRTPCKSDRRENPFVIAKMSNVRPFQFLIACGPNGLGH